MGLFDQFPYTNFHELNLMWILQALKEIETTTEQFVAINSLKYADPIQWNIVKQYEKNTIVIDPLTGTAYISVAAVPSGVALTNEDYWTVVFNLGSFVTKAAKNFTERWEEATTLTATFNTAAGQWLVWGDTLYRAASNIIAGDSYVIDSNIIRITIEEIKDEIYNTFNGMIGDLQDLETQDKNNIVNAINEIIDIIGDLQDLDTQDKTNLIAAINEVFNIVNSLSGGVNINVINEGADNTGTNDSLTSFLTAFNKAYDAGVKVIIPDGVYKLSQPILVDVSLIENNLGTYTDYSVVVSTSEYKDFRHYETYRKIGQLITGYSLQSCEYVQNDNYYIFGLTSNNNGRIIVTDNNYNIIRDSGDLDIGHVNDMAYNPTNRTISVVAGNYSTLHNREVIIISYDSLTITNTIALQKFAWQISYDIKNKFYIILTSENGDQIIIYDNDFNFIKSLGYEYPVSINGTLITQSTFIINGQLYLIYNVTTEVIATYPTYTAFGIIRYNYTSGNIIDYMQWPVNTLRDEVECGCIANNIITLFGGQFFFFSTLLISDRAASIGSQNVSTYRTMIPYNADLNDYVLIGEYCSGWGAITATISNIPSGVISGFNLDTIMQSVDHMLQILHENWGSYYYREFNATTNVWSSWNKVAILNDIPNYEIINKELYVANANISANNPYYDYTFDYNHTFSEYPRISVTLKGGSSIEYNKMTVKLQNVTKTSATIRIYYFGNEVTPLNPALDCIAISRT